MVATHRCMLLWALLQTPSVAAEQQPPGACEGDELCMLQAPRAQDRNAVLMERSSATPPKHVDDSATALSPRKLSNRLQVQDMELLEMESAHSLERASWSKDEGVYSKKDMGSNTTSATGTQDQDLLTVMTYNTFLLKINVLPGVAYQEVSNLAERSAGIADWFNSLRDEELPDVLVLQEIYSKEGEELMQSVCSKSWVKNSKWWASLAYTLKRKGGHANTPYIACDNAGSKFAFATRVANTRNFADTTLFKASGIVVLVKKGVQVTSVEDVLFDDCAGTTCLSSRGFWAVTLQKGTQKYWVYGTHAIAYMKHAELRQKQFAQMRAHIKEVVEDGARLVIAGDMNIASGPYTDVDGKHVKSPTEKNDMLTTFGYDGSKFIVGDNEPMGFWLPLNSSLNVTASPKYNHYVHSYQEEIELGDQMYDWVLAPGPGDRLATPVSMRYQIVPIKSDSCFVSEQKGDSKELNGGDGYPKGTNMDDLSDHYGVFAELRWTDSKTPAVEVVRGHRGSTGIIPAGPTC